MQEIGATRLDQIWQGEEGKMTHCWTLNRLCNQLKETRTQQKKSWTWNWKQQWLQLQLQFKLEEAMEEVDAGVVSFVPTVEIDQIPQIEYKSLAQEEVQEGMGPQQKEAKMNCLWSMDQVWKLSL